MNDRYLAATIKPIDMRGDLIASLRKFGDSVENAPGHKHLYAPFDDILNALENYLEGGNPIDGELATEILEVVKVLVCESSQGRRPWSSDWENYFAKCFKNAHKLILAYCKFDNYRKFIPLGFCNILDFALRLDQYADDLPGYWHIHYAEMCVLASEMVKLIADEEMRIDNYLLENPDDRFFANILTAYAQTGKAKDMLLGYTLDDEESVRLLARHLLERYYFVNS